MPEITLQTDDGQVTINSLDNEVAIESVDGALIEVLSDTSNVEIISLQDVVQVQSVVGSTVQLDSVNESTVLLQESPLVVNIESVGFPGPAGPPGPPGGPGPVGPQGPGDAQVIDFPVPSTEWVIDIGKLADVVVIDSAGTVQEPGDIKYEGNKVTLTFSAAFSGRVLCFT